MELEIQRINSYTDERFHENVLKQHGAFLVNQVLPYEVEITGKDSAVVRGEKEEYFAAVIEEFRFFAEHITKFYDKNNRLLKQYDEVPVFTVELAQIQPSQFYVDKEKKEAVASFVQSEEDVIVPVIPYGERYISFDGHTRMAVAADKGITKIKAFFGEDAEYIHDFVAEAVRRGVTTPYDLPELPHGEYEVKWNQFCDAYFAEGEEE